MNIIEINNLNISFSNNTFYSISGPNNSGKTTLIRSLNKELEVDNILINNKNINSYSRYELSKIIQKVIPLEIEFLGSSLSEELEKRDISNDMQEYLLKSLKMKSISKVKFNELTKKDIIFSQIVIALASNPQVLLLDCISNYLTNYDIKKLYKFFKEYQDNYELTVVSTTNKLEDTLYSDYLYIINDGNVYLEGEPLEILQKDNVLNKLGLNIPFMIDLSVKLRDYNLIDNIELDRDRMVDILWK